VLAFMVAPLVALSLAVTLPAACAVVALALVGVAHLGLETRYIAGRFSVGVAPLVLGLLFVPLTAIAMLRLANFGPVGTRAEVVLALGLLVGAWALMTRGTLLVGPVGLAFGAVLVAAALARPDLYLVAVAQLHNLAPVVFLWEWSRSRGRRAGRAAFRMAQLGWAAVVPALILLGTFDRWLAGWGLWSWAGDRSAGEVAAVYTPAGWAGPWPARFLAVFAFGQLMHYVIWCGYFPAVAGAEHRQAARTATGWLWRPRVFVRTVAVVTAAVMVLQVVAAAQGRRLYSAIASYHAYLEYPLLAVLLATVLVARTRKDAAWLSR
jgi:hypothetical protein